MSVWGARDEKGLDWLVAIGEGGSMSFKVFSGSDRVKIQKKIKEFLGEDYEVFEGKDLNATDLMEICTGVTLFSSERRILVRDLTPARGGKDGGGGKSGADGKSGTAENEVVAGNGFEPYEVLAKYADSPHRIAIWETNLSRKKSFREFCKLKQVTQEKIEAAEQIDRFAIFKIFDKALVDGEAAAREYRALNTDPYLAVGALASWAVNKYKFRGGERERRILKEVAELDIQTKTLKIAPELLVEGVILRLAEG